MSIALLTPVAPTNILEQGHNSERNQSSKYLHSHSGRSVHEYSSKTAGTIIAKETMQRELNPSQSEIMDSSSKSHCQFYAHCTDCLRFQAKAGNADKTTQIPQTNEGLESNSGSMLLQEKHSHSDKFIANATESCKRIKPTTKPIHRQNIS